MNNDGITMKAYETILFDLDGTLTDPGLGITNSVIHALKRLKISPPPREELYKFIGPPLHESFEVFYSLTRDEAMTAVDYYREYYKEQGIFENRLYDGIPSLLEHLSEKDKKLILATSKPEVFAKRILEHFNIDKYFSSVCGALLDGSRTDKSEVIAYALNGTHRLDSTIMVGDRKHDIIGATKTGIDSIGVLFGYGSAGELMDAGATYICETVNDIEKIINRS